METRTIVVKDVEVIDRGPPPEGGHGGPPGPLQALGRLLLRVAAAALVLALVIPAVVLGGACVVVAIVVALVTWAVRRIVR